MDTAEPAPAPPLPILPLWKRIVNFPLVSMLIALALITAVIALASAVVTAVLRGAGKELADPVMVAAVIAALIVLHKTVLRRLGTSGHDDLPINAAPRDLAVRVLGAAVLFSMIVGVAALLGAYRIVGWGGLTGWVLVLVGAGFNAGFVEEFIFRGILFRWIEDFGGSWAALVITSGLFGLAHIGNDNASLLSSFTIAVEAGLMLGGAYMLTRSLWLPVGIHFGWNVTQGLVWDVPVSGNAVDGLVDARLEGDPLLSGGAFGLEASLIALVLAGGVGVWLIWRAVRAGRVMAPWWVRRKAAAAGA